MSSSDESLKQYTKGMAKKYFDKGYEVKCTKFDDQDCPSEYIVTFTKKFRFEGDALVWIQEAIEKGVVTGDS